MCLSVGRCRLPAGVSLGCEPAPLLWRPAVGHGMVKGTCVAEKCEGERHCGFPECSRRSGSDPAWQLRCSRTAWHPHFTLSAASLIMHCMLHELLCCNMLALKQRRRKKFCQTGRRSRTALAPYASRDTAGTQARRRRKKNSLAATGKTTHTCCHEDHKSERNGDTGYAHAYVLKL